MTDEEVVEICFADTRNVQTVAGDAFTQILVRARLGGLEQLQTPTARAWALRWPASWLEWRSPAADRGALVVKLVQRGPLTSPEAEIVLGEATVQLRGVTGNEFEKWVTLERKKGAGEILIRARFTSNAKLEDKYDLREVIGCGATATVYRAVEKDSGLKVAVKVIEKAKQEPGQVALLEREIAVMKKLRHPNIVQLFDVYKTVETISIVMELIEGGELFDRIATRGRFMEKDAGFLFRQMLLAVQYMHQQNIAHRDLKPENVLLQYTSRGTEIKISDFGLAKDFGIEAMRTVCGSPDYVAPEVLFGNEYGCPCDVWSLGVMLYVLLSGYLPFHDSSQSFEELYDRISRADFSFDKPIWDRVGEQPKEMIRIMLEKKEEDQSVDSCSFWDYY
eukprot:m51a1_g13960 putative myosin light chain (392) ;mRNA; f:952637-954663